MMLELTSFLGIFLFALVWIIFQFGRPKGVKKPTTVPGLDPSDPRTGNVTDLAKAGSIHQFLSDLHRKYGPIASYWLGEQLTVSIASAEYFKQNIGLFDRPPGVLASFIPIMGPKAIAFANGEDAKLRRSVYDKCYSHGSIQFMYPIFNQAAKEVVAKWSEMVGDAPISITDYLYYYTLKVLSKASFGDYFNDEQEIKNLRTAYEGLFFELDKHMVAGTQPEEGTPGRKAVDEGKKSVDACVAKIVKHRLAHPPSGDEYLLIDAILDLDTGEQAHSDALNYIIGGFHTTGTGLVWTMYFLASHPEVQDRAAQEVVDMIGDEDVDGENTGKLVYLRQVIDETIRCSVLGPFAARYAADADTKLGNHVIPAGTPIMHAIGVASQDPKVWPDPEKFDPDRFSPENVRSRPALAFSPFGFAGKRKCPGYRFWYAESITLLAVLLRRFRIKIVGQLDVVRREFGFVTVPSEEIRVTLENRDSD